MFTSISQWLSAVKEDHDLENPTLDKMRRVMSLVYKHGQRYGLIPRREGATRCALSAARLSATTKR